MAKTPNIALNLIPFDTTPWDQPDHENMSIIDGLFAQFFSIGNFVGVWKNITNYTVGQSVIDAVDGSQWQCLLNHTSPVAPTTFASDRAAFPLNWIQTGASASASAAAAAASATAAAASAVTAASVGAAASTNTGRNLLHNGQFRVFQRGSGPFTTSGTVGIDRWLPSASVSTFSQSPLALADADRTAIGDELAALALQSVVVGTAGATDFVATRPSIETVRLLAGKTVTVSFWAKATAGTPKLALEMTQNFGTGGSPSATVTGIGSQSFTLSTTWTRYTSTPIVIPSIAGMTLGSNGDNYTGLQFWQTAGSTFNARTASIGQQSYTLQLWGVQCEVGTVASPLEKPDFSLERIQCYRYYYVSGAMRLTAYQAIGSGMSVGGILPVRMRATPTVTYGFSVQTNTTGSSMTAIDPSNVILSVGAATATGPVQVLGTYIASAEI